MTMYEEPRAITRAETSGSAPLWFGILAGPLAWGLQLAVLYMLEEFISCTPASQDQGAILGVGVKSIALAVTGVLATVTIAAGIVSIRCLRRWYFRGQVGYSNLNDQSAERARWMAMVGVINSALFLAIILVKIAPPLLLDVCRTTL